MAKKNVTTHEELQIHSTTMGEQQILPPTQILPITQEEQKNLVLLETLQQQLQQMPTNIIEFR